MTPRHRRTLPWCEPQPLLTALLPQLEQPGLVWLDGDGSPLGSHSFLAIEPQAEVVCRGLPGDVPGRDPFNVLAELQADGGHWLGWLGYEAAAWLEPGSHWQQPAMAVLWAMRVDPLLVFAHGPQQLWLEGEDPRRLERLGQQLDHLIQALPAAARQSSAPGLAPRLPLESWHWHSDPSGFAAGVRQLQELIAAGDLFQANLTTCCEQQLPDRLDPAALLALYGRLRHHCPAPFAGLAIAGTAAAGEAILSASPERFLQLTADGLVETRPIKGTRPRHADPMADADAAAELVTSPKDRAENVMIVDLLRNDLGRVCRPGSVRVPQLVGLESYRQVHHLTSVVQGQLHAHLGPAELLRACWPGGSITGAPKIRACQRLNALEPQPRGPYCGSLFRLQGQRSLDSSILIRSLFVQQGNLRVHGGCGIVADSDPQAEAEELGWKLQPLLTALAGEPAPSLAWIDTPGPEGRWGAADSLALPIGDRGLLLADGLFETVLVLDGQPRLLEQHLRRWHAGAEQLGMEPPPQLPQVERLARDAVARSGISDGALRLNWSRGLPQDPNSRGIAIPHRCQHRFWLQLSATTPSFAPVRVLVSRSERRDPQSVLSGCKTFAYASAIQARREAAACGCDDALLSSSGASGELACGSSANLLVRQGDAWLTPPLSSGCLPGVMRARALELGLAQEASLQPQDLLNSQGALLINSLGCRPIQQLEGQPIGWPEPLSEQAAALWHSLLTR